MTIWLYDFYDIMNDIEKCDWHIGHALLFQESLSQLEKKSYRESKEGSFSILLKVSVSNPSLTSQMSCRLMLSSPSESEQKQVKIETEGDRKLFATWMYLQLTVVREKILDCECKIENVSE